MNTKSLEIIFETASQKTLKLTVPNLAMTITKEILATQIQHIINSNVLNMPNDPIKQAKSAKLIDKAVTLLEINE
ncbi:DUF2922 domain-containing protein [Staphylococcus canis]|uniref:DUF2922 domain-containing protein n=1 Tax=Staphylococcus canis TaxID=2724942 RepID=A0ABS0T8T3_9STAP|nr:DUF2922 domain-containing protein [Staphylococcus canis]MBI5975123.1 DUF2922 domain-containing protein [Staphylococcus canis]